MSRVDAGSHVLPERPHISRTLHHRMRFTSSHLLRCLLACLILCTFVIGAWSLMVPRAYAASLAAAASTNTNSTQQPAALQGHRPPAHPTVTPSSTPAARHKPPRSTGTDPKPPAQHPQSGTAGSVDGLGVQSFYTYVSQRLTDRTDLKVNVANGNLVLHDSVLHIRGTGIDLSIDTYYNPQSSSPQTDLSTHWNLSTGADVYLQFNGDGSITFYGPSGYSALFVPNGSGGYLDPMGLNATLTTQSSDGAYHLDFHQTKETFEFGSSGRLIDDEDKNGNQLTFAYTGSQLSTITDSQNRVTSFTYYTSGVATGQLKLITDPANRSVLYSYDANDNLSSITDLDGNVTSFGYESGSDDLTSITDPLNRTTSIAYGSGSLDQVASITDATGATTGFSYTSGNTVVTDANGHATTYTSDSSNRVTTVEDALGHTTVKSYTPNSDIHVYTDALSTNTDFAYDGANNLMSMTNMATTEQTAFTYTDTQNNPSFPTSKTDAQNHTITYSYDAHGNLVKVADSNGNATTYVYNTSGSITNGTLAEMTDANTHSTTYSYDAVGNLTKVNPPGPLGTITSTYDSLSRIKTVTDGKGQTTSYSYDGLDRILSISYANGGTMTYEYDDNGNLSSITDNTGTTSFTYDKDNRQLTKKLPGTEGTITVSYDPVGNLQTLTDSGSGVSISYGYNKVNLLTTLTEPNNQQTSFGYDAKNERTSVLYPNQVEMKLTYDQAGHEIEVQGQNTSTHLKYYELAYAYGSTDVRNTVTDQLTTNQIAYTYDPQNRLTEAEYLDSHGTKIGDYDYSYDGVGNRTQQKVGLNPVTTNYSYNAANELTASTGGTALTYSYDLNGNETGVSHTTLSYNAKNQTTSITPSSFTYTGPDQTERVQVDNTSFTYSGLGLDTQSDSSGTTFYVRDTSGNLVDERTPNGRYYYLLDGQGSVIGLTDSSGNLVGNSGTYLYQYDPYGNLTNTPPNAVLQNNPWRFASGYFDSTTGLYKFGTRYYDPTVGRWTQQDPAGAGASKPCSVNRYIYVEDDPVNEVDPSGACTPIELIGYILLDLSVGIVVVLLLSQLLPLLLAATGLVAQLGILFGTALGWESLAAILGVLGSSFFVGTCFASVQHGGT